VRRRYSSDRRRHWERGWRSVDDLTRGLAGCRLALVRVENGRDELVRHRDDRQVVAAGNVLVFDSLQCDVLSELIVYVVVMLC